MSEQRFKVIDNDFSMWIVDTTLKEDKHEGAIYTAYDMCRKLNELFEENEQLKQKLENLGLNEKNDMLDSMKKGIKENPTLKKYLDKMVSDGIDEDTALNIMILAWQNHKRWNDE